MILRDYTAADLDGMTTKQARAALQQHIDAFNRENEPDPVKCIATVRDCMPRLYAAAFPPAADNDGDEPTPLPNSAPPAAYQFHLPMMRLPQNTTKDEFNIAWRANGSVPTPVKEKAIYDALVGYYIASQKMTQAQAEKAVADKFPLIAPVSK